MADPIVAPIPGASGSSGYLQSNLDANTAYKNALARINQQRLGTLQQYGYQGDVNPTDGTIQNMRVDPTNPYGNLQSMLRTQAQQSQSDLYASEDRGLHGGLANQAQSADKYNFGQQSAALGQGLTNTLGGYTDQQNTAAYQRDAALAQAEQLAAEQAILNGQFTGANFSGDGSPGTPDLYGQGQLFDSIANSGDALAAWQKRMSATTAAQKLVKAAVAKASVAKPTVKAQAYVPASASKTVAQAIVNAAKKKGGK